MEYTYQFFTGGYEDKNSGAEAVAVLKTIYEKLGPGDVIIGWNIPYDQYDGLTDFVHEYNKKIWFWLPVFSEHPSFKSPDALIDFNGNILKRPDKMKNEDFYFSCPSSEKNISITLSLYKKYFSHYHFDGIFLDKIRHASFVGGIESGMGCFCKQCKELYKKNELDIDKVINTIMNNPAELLPVLFEEGRYSFENNDINNFYKVKSMIITESVTAVINHFNESGLETSLDVFAPVMAYMVGQDIDALNNNISFIKPMFYRITYAPAGIPFEISAYKNTFKALGVDASKVLEKIWGTESFCNDHSFEKQLHTVDKKLTRPGFEVNIVPGICDCTQDYAASTVNLLTRQGFTHSVLSWNLLGDVGDILDAL